MVTLSRSSGVARVGIPLGLSDLLAAKAGASAYTMSFDGYTAGTLVSRVVEARGKHYR